MLEGRGEGSWWCVSVCVFVSILGEGKKLCCGRVLVCCILKDRVFSSYIFVYILCWVIYSLKCACVCVISGRQESWLTILHIMVW